MSKSTITLDVKKDVLNWIIDSSAWTEEEIAKRLNTNVQNIKKISLGEKKPTFRQLRELSIAFKRPIASFLLSEPKKEKPQPKDYRMLPDRVDKFDKKTIIVLRNARRLQELSRELSKNIDYTFKLDLKKFKIQDNPKELATKYRKLFDLSEEKQRKFKNPYELFRHLRDKLEDLNIYVFQFSMPVEDARGFVFVDENPKVVVVNTKDSIEARIFSLMHEFGHILLGESAIDLPDVTKATRNDIERWCNLFSSSFLLPEILAKQIFNENKETLTQGKTLTSLSRKYKVSKAMLLVNMKKLKFIQEDDYNKILSRFNKENQKKKEESSKSGGAIASDRKILSEVGNKFVSLVANNYDKEFITYTDALNYLSVKSKNFDKVLANAKK